MVNGVIAAMIIVHFNLDWWWWILLAIALADEIGLIPISDRR